MTFKNGNSWALIVGGSGGMGMASAKRLALEGMNIIIIHRDRRSRLPDVETDFGIIRKCKVKLISYNVDGLNPQVITDTLALLKEEIGEGSIRLFLHSLAKGNLKPIRVSTEEQSPLTDVSNEIKDFYKAKSSGFSEIKAEMKPQDLTLTIDAMGINFYDWAKKIFDLNLFSNEARIIGLTSEGDKKVWEGYAAVASAKAVLDALCKYMAISFAKEGITTNLIQAGVTITESFNLIPGSDFIAQSTKMRNPNERLTSPEDVADVVYLLCRNEARWINGTTIIADGGEHLI